MKQSTYAETVNYWKTGQSSPDTWLDHAKTEITAVGGKVLADGFINEASSGRASFMLAFELDGERFKVLWPVLESKTGNLRAARIQSATALYHEVKAACVKLRFLGARSAFLAYWMLPDGSGRTASEVTLEDDLPQLLGGRPVMVLEAENL